MAKLTWLVVASLMTVAMSDLYMSYMRGSNNRLNEQAANRDNGDRLYDSQNNNRGGYNVGDRSATAFNENSPTLSSPDLIYNPNDKTTAAQYPMVFFEKSMVPIEWSNQHGCGGNAANDPNKLNCNIVLQYMCDTPRTNDQTAASSGYSGDYAMSVYLYDGGNTNTPNAPNTASDVTSGTTFTSNNNNQFGRHESEGWYYECETRSRNTRLFHADQNLNGNTAIYTRQNPNGARRGLECPEERDYYPYWSPNPWRDVAYMTDRADDNNFVQMIEDNSMNLVGNSKYKCKGASYTNTAAIAALTPQDCTSAGGTWTAFSHNMPAADPLNKIQVKVMPWTRDNHLGNTRSGYPAGFNWTLPAFSSLAGPNVRTFGSANNYIKCVFRLRYNLSTDDYDPWNTTSDSDNNPNTGVMSPVTQNPTVDVGAQDLQGLALAINTNQFGRTFQDRSHVFYIKQRPAGGLATGTIYNLGVRGKRGNIVQVYPAVEYDFVPQYLQVNAGDYIHMQWTGSNTHNNGDPGGDGQTGDAGEGTEGTDRTGWVQAGNTDANFPLPLDKYQTESLLLSGNSNCYNLDGSSTADASENVAGTNCALILATSGYFRTVTEVSGSNGQFSPTLDNSPASLLGGIILQPNAQAGSGNVNSPKIYNYINCRNNNFSNRAQKGAILVV